MNYGVSNLALGRGQEDKTPQYVRRAMDYQRDLHIVPGKYMWLKSRRTAYNVLQTQKIECLPSPHVRAQTLTYPLHLQYA